MNAHAKHKSASNKRKTVPNKRPSTRAPKGVDKLWFDQQFDRAGLSQRQVAAAAGMDPAQLNRALKGTRRFQSHELDAVAKAIGASSATVMRHTPYLVTDGVSVEASTTDRAAATPRLAGHVDGATGRVQLDKEAGAKVRGELEGERAALSVEGAPFLSGARIVFMPREVPASTLSGRVGLVRLRDGSLWLRAVRPGFRPGHWDLGPALGIGRERQDDADVTGAMRVEGLVFPESGGGQIEVTRMARRVVSGARGRRGGQRQQG